MTWGGETLNIGLRDEGLANKMRDITDEFRVMHALLGGRQGFRHDLNVYIMNAWGTARSWAAWLQVNECQDILTHLTDLPVNVRFISLAEIAENGVPTDAHVLMNYGEPGSAWSGGSSWGDERLVDAVTHFVHNGGGLIGVGAPSHFPKNGKTWQLSHLFGLEYGGAADPEADDGSYTKYDVIFLGKGKRSVVNTEITRTPQQHWITERTPAAIESVLFHNCARTVADDVTVLCAQNGEGQPPAVAARNVGKGRAVYINGYSGAPEYGRVLRRSVFWAAGMESDLSRLWAENPTIFTYLYPEIPLLVVYNMSREDMTAKVTVDLSLLDLPAGKEYAFVDRLSGKRLASASILEAANGVDVPVIGGGIRFLDIRADTDR